MRTLLNKVAVEALPKTLGEPATKQLVGGFAESGEASPAKPSAEKK